MCILSGASRFEPVALAGLLGARASARGHLARPARSPPPFSAPQVHAARRTPAGALPASQTALPAATPAPAAGGEEDAPLFVGDPAQVMGFGATAEGGANTEVLQVANVTMADLRACNASYGGVLRAGQICAGARARGGLDALLLCARSRARAASSSQRCDVRRAQTSPSRAPQACPRAAATRARATLAGPLL